MKLKAMELIDFYKTGHIKMYPEGTEVVYSNFTPRSDRLAAHMSKMWDHKVVFAGLQGVIRWLLIDMFNDTFFNVPHDEAVENYRQLCDQALGAGVVSTEHVSELHKLGYLPLLIKALPEGSRVNIGVPVYTVINTHPDFAWVTNYVETMLSSETWKTTTNATVAYEYRRLMEDYAERTGAPKDFVLWQGHDFSARGMSGMHDAAQSGLGHLLSFYGTDTVPAIRYAKEYYGAGFVGASVPATEHSVMCMGGNESEVETFRRLIEDVYPSGIISIVSDTWDFFKVISEYSIELKDKILARTPNALGQAKVVFRPDSGDPVDILCGTATQVSFQILPGDEVEHLSHHKVVRDVAGNFFQINAATGKWSSVKATPEMRGSVECLWDIFGGTTTDKGFKVLHERVGLIYGDSITLDRADQIMSRLAEKGFASCNCVFGIGSYTYNYNTRDTYGMAIKATYGVVNGEPRELFKDPVTDNGTKKSAKGLLRVEEIDGNFVLFDQQTPEQENQGELVRVFENSIAYNIQTLDGVRNLLHP